MKAAFLLFSLLILLALEAKAGLPPTNLKGQKEAAAKTTFFFQAPNNTATPVAGSTGLIETGNKNILSNPSFEHSAFSTGWTTTGAATFAEETTVVLDGNKAASFVASANAFTLTQDSTLYQAQLADVVQCMASAMIKSNASGVQICPRQAGVTSTTNCLTVDTANKWELYRIPFNCGGTSNGISIASSTTAGTTYIDDVFVGPIDSNILSVSDTFSTDTNTLTYAGSATYTLGTLTNAPVGTFITFTYAGSTNTRVQTTTAPTQTTSSMNTNGIQIFSRAYTATSTAGNPSAIAIQIGKGLKGKTLDFYKSAGKITAGDIDYVQPAAAEIYGIRSKDYNEKTGILIIDAGTVGTAVTTTGFIYSDQSIQTNGYLVVNASKNPSLIGVSDLFPGSVLTPNVSKPLLVSASIDASEAITEDDSGFLTSCTNADPSVCTVTTSFFSADPKCWANPTAAGTIAIVTADTTTSITVDRTDASTPFKLFCHGYR